MFASVDGEMRNRFWSARRQLVQAMLKSWELISWWPTSGTWAGRRAPDLEIVILISFLLDDHVGSYEAFGIVYPYHALRVPGLCPVALKTLFGKYTKFCIRHSQVW